MSFTTVSASITTTFTRLILPVIAIIYWVFLHHKGEEVSYENFYNHGMNLGLCIVEMILCRQNEPLLGFVPGVAVGTVYICITGLAYGTNLFTEAIYRKIIDWNTPAITTKYIFVVFAALMGTALLIQFIQFVVRMIARRR